MRGLACFASAAILALVLLIGSPAYAREGAAGGFGFGAAHGLAGWQGRIGGLRAGGPHRGLRAPAPRLGSGVHRRTTVGPAPPRDAAYARAPIGFDHRFALHRAGLPAARWAFGWNRGWRAPGWWIAGWVFPWDWAGYPGPCYQWVYPPSGPPYCALPDAGEL